MRKWLVMSVIGGLALLPALAFADVDITVTITKTKDQTITETLDITKDVDIDVDVKLKTHKAAESDTLVNQKNEDNKDSNAFTGSNSAINSVSGSGIVNVNQASGNMNNQANAVSVAVDPGGSSNNNGFHFFDRFDPDSAFAHSQAAADQKNENNESKNFFASSTSSLTVGGTGIVNVNQASGSMNNQANAVSVAVGVGSKAGVALSEADLGQVNSYNYAGAAFYASSATINNVTGSGIVNVNQSSGHMNNQSNVVSVAAVN
jgi:hypothetical protein